MPNYTYNELDSSVLTKEELINNELFLDDASVFLENRTDEIYEDPEELYDAYMSHMRDSEVNEWTTYQDWMYVSELKDEEEKKRAARLYHTFDKMNAFGGSDDIGDIAQAFGDYAVGVMSAPSTYIGILTGGTGKVAAVGGQQVAKAAVRKSLMKNLMKSGAKRAAAVEGGIGAVQDVGNQAVRMEVDPDREFSAGQFALSTGISAVTGGVLSAPNSYFQSRNAIKAERMKNIGERAEARVVVEAVNTAKETVSKASYRPLDEIKVELGEAVRTEKLDTLTAGERAFVGLDDDTFTRIQAAAIDIIGDVKPKVYADGTKQRITEAVGDAISSGKFKPENLNEILNKYKLTNDQLGMIYIADVSRAAKVLNTSSQIKRFKNMAENVEKLAKDNASLFSAVDAEDFSNASNLISTAMGKSSQTVRAFERMRRSVLTSQIQTTQRNFLGGGARVTLDALDGFFDASYKGIVNGAARILGAGDDVPFKDAKKVSDVLSVFKYMLKPAEAQLILDAYSGRMPAEANRLLSHYVDAGNVSAQTGVGNAFQRIGMWANIANRASDNFYKRAIFAGELSRLTRARTGKDALELFVNGKFSEVDEKSMINAAEKAYDLLYQAEPTDPVSKFWLKMDRTATGGLILGSILPYPRFVSNQIRFMAEYAPFIGLLADSYFKPRKGAYSKYVKQMSGLTMLAGFGAWRATQPADSEWWSYTKEDGTKGDLRPGLAGFSMFLYLGDLMNKDHAGMPNDYTNGNFSKIKDQLIELGMGTSFRIGFSKQAYDGVLPEIFGDESLSTKSNTYIGKMLGDMFAPIGYNMMSGTARDLFQLTNEEARYVPETNGEVNWYDIFVMRATRGLPAFMRPESDNRYTITSPLPTKTESPLSAMATGINLQRPSNIFEKELSYLQINPYEIYKPIPFGPADVEMRQILSQKLPQFMTAYIETNSSYKNSKSDDEKRIKLLDVARAQVSAMRGPIFDKLVEEADERNLDKKQIRRFEFESTGSREDRRAFAPRYRQKFGKTLDLDTMSAFEIKQATNYLEDVMRAVRKSTAEPQKFNEGGLVGKTRSGQKIYDSGDDDVTKEALGLALDLAPVTGEIRSAIGALEDFEKGNYGMAALGVMGAAPVVGAPARAVRKGLGAKKLLDDLPPPEAAQKTQIAGTLPTYVKAKKELDSVKPEGKTLDFGAGLGIGAKEIDADSYEPFAREGFDPTFTKSTDIPSESYDKVTNLNVLNVVPKEVRDDIVKEIGRVLKPGGTAVITTRGKDVLTAKGRKGPEENSVITTSGTYQKGFTKAELEEYVKETLGEGFNIKRLNLGKAGVTVTKK